MATTTAFEKALQLKNVEIEEIKKTDTGRIQEVIGWLGQQVLSWSNKGKCYRGRYRVPEHDLTFE